jgi:hypothetical protein
LFESMCHGEVVEPVVVEYNVAVREYTMTQLMCYSHLDFSCAMKTKNGEQFGVRQTDCHASDKVTFCNDFPSV